MGRAAGVLTPAIIGPEPTSYEIEPDLPLDLLLDPVTGEISGSPVEVSPLTEYTIFTTYDDFPESSATIQIQVLGAVVATVDPDEPLVDFESIGEFEFPGDPEGWTRNARIAEFQVDGGTLRVETTGDDPFFWRNFGGIGVNCLTVDLRIRIDQGDTNWQVFWGEDAPGRGNFGAVGQPFSFGGVDDGQFHVYRLDFTSAVEGPLTAFRLDPGGGSGTILHVDYVRLGSCTSDSPNFLRSDVDGNGTLQITDPIAALGYLFSGSFDPVCLDAIDFDDNGEINITDAVASLSHLFSSGPPPAPPGKEVCGPDPDGDADGLDCLAYPQEVCP